VRKLIKLGLIASVFTGASAASAQEMAAADKTKEVGSTASAATPTPQAGTTVPNARREAGWVRDYVGSGPGAPEQCMAEPTSAAATDGASTQAEGVGWSQIRSSILQCSAGLGGNAEPYLRRRMVYSGISTTGALGAAIGGARAAVSTTNAWLGLALLPIIFEGTFDRPEFDQVEGVTAYNLNWIVSRGDDLNRQQDALGERVSAMDTYEGNLDQLIEGLAAGSQARDRQADEALLAALQARVEKDDAQGATEAPATPANNADAQLLEQLRRRLERGSRQPASERPVDAERARDSMSQLITDLVRLRGNAGAIRDAAAAQQSYIKQDLPSWGYEKYIEVMSVYGSSRRDMSLRPESAFRNVLALPLSTMATLIRGGRQLSDSELYAQHAMNSMRRINPAMGISAVSLAAPETVHANLADFHPEDRLYVQRALDAARMLRQESAATLELINAGVRLDGTAMPEPSVAPSTSAAPAPTPPPAQPSGSTPAAGGETPPEPKPPATDEQPS
jgi:hypothetical protein